MTTKPETLAVIDIGTNTFRLLIAKVKTISHKYIIDEVRSERVITRLGEGIIDGNFLTKGSMDRGIETLKRFKKAISGHNVSSVSAIGTSALREAKNKDVFINRVRDEAGIDIEIINEEQEARLTAIGMTMDIALPESALLIDIGGGSTEFIFMNNGKISNIQSLKLGVVYLTERYMKNDPPSEKELMDMEEEVEKGLDAIRKIGMYLSVNAVLIGTAGTITALSAMLQGLDRFEHNRVHKTVIHIEPVIRIWEELSCISMRQRGEIYPVLMDQRLDIIVPGILILKSIMMTFGFKELTVSDNGLREGMIIELYKNTQRCE